MKKEIVILTKSIKHGGFCVAGIAIDTGLWIRLVSDDDEAEGAVSKNMLQYSNGEEVAVYDIIEVELIRAVPTSVQPENWLYDKTSPWEKKGISVLQDVINLHGYDSPEYVFGNTEVSLPAEWQFKGEPSLLLLEVSEAYIWIKTFPEKKSVTLNFEYNGQKYNYIKISQKEIKGMMRSDGSHYIGKRSIVISLTDQYYYNDKYYKVIAQILD